MENKSNEPPSPEPVDIDMTQLTTPGLFMKSPSDSDSNKSVQHHVADPSKVKDMETDNSIKTTVVTLQPYEANKPKKKRIYKPDPTLIHFDSLFGSESWSRYLTLETDRIIPTQKLENYLLTRCPTKEMSFRQIKENQWLVETTTKKQSESYLSITNINSANVKVTKHDTMNSIFGTVIIPFVEEEIDKTTVLDSLQKRYDNIQNCEIYDIPSKKNKEVSLKIAKIKFEGQTLPLKIKILGQNREVRPHVPKPLQCKNCSRYGHTTKKCNSDPRCAYCGSEEHATIWNHETPKCLNCGQNHHSRSKECSFYIYNTELKILQERTGMSIREAKLELKGRGLNDPSKKSTYRMVSKQTIESNRTVSSNVMVQPTIVTKGNVNKHHSSEITTVHNRYEILNTMQSDEVSAEKTQNQVKQSQQHNIQKKSQAPPKVVQQPKRRLSRENSEMDEISPSPVFPPKSKPILKKPRDEREYDNTSKTSMTDSTSSLHHERCGCHDCFVTISNKETPLSKEKLTNIIRNFMEARERSSLGALSAHQENCMCVNHLMYYKRNQIKILDKYLENQGKEASDISAPSSTSKSDINKRKPDISTSVRSKENH